MKRLYIIVFVAAFNAVLAQTATLGLFDAQMDGGHPKNAGSAKYDGVTHTYLLKVRGTIFGLTGMNSITCIKR